ncbi:MAG: 16S rRNA (guanine(527)-N(7))-methyltransferase RsmG [Rhodospirillales bacterium]|nr:16S rRNA (guanine(527)-N(7))-methyltransferase RsmG [Alphaproteobacteria bacterium]USO04109.1 MAG: 16S rRNA (guanine(527)-N(7))-methyltransferase RsmG [Rhodospirillales bacterium]
MPDFTGNVSRETRDRLEAYQALLQKWQPKINLVSPKTLAKAWERHFKDSLQLINYIPDSPQTLFDIGSGAGFPGLVLAIVRPDLDVHLVESDEKKCAFLGAVSRETRTKVTIHNMRIEDAAQALDAAPDIITARALAPLERLLEYCRVWGEKNPDLKLVFPKGEKAEEEVSLARQKWAFDLEKHPSRTEGKAHILVLKQVRRLPARCA